MSKILHVNCLLIDIVDCADYTVLLILLFSLHLEMRNQGLVATQVLIKEQPALSLNVQRLKNGVN